MHILNKIQNEQWSSFETKTLSSSILFISAIGYEERSSFLINKVIPDLNPTQVCCFFFTDFEKHDHSRYTYQKMITNKIEPIFIAYNDCDLLLDKVINRITQLLHNNSAIEIHIDYSSMPRSWYCRLALSLPTIVRKNDKVYFWYSEGEYNTDGERFPSAGVKDFTVFSGRCSLSANGLRSHIFGLGYDHIRSQAIFTVLDPSYLVACYSYPSNRRDVLEKIRIANQDILTSALYSFALPIDDFVFTLSRMNDASRELLGRGDVVIVPDGPKPLILACSLVPTLINMVGVVCLHISRHQTHYEPLNVVPTGNIYGFSFMGSI